MPLDRFKRSLHILAPLALLSLAVGLRVIRPQAVEGLQNAVFDSFQRLRPRPYEAVPVRILDMDNESLSRLGQWPWPRTLLARTVSRLNDLGASAIAFDAVFSEPDRTSPSQVMKVWPSTPETKALKSQLSRIPDHDLLFAEAIASARVVTGFSLIHDANNSIPASKAGFGIGGDDPSAFVESFSGAVVNLPELEKAAAGNGSFNIRVEQDGIVRRVPMLFKRGESLFPSLMLEALRVAQGAGGYKVKSSGASGEKSFGEHTGISQIKVGSLLVPTDGLGRFWVYYTAEAPARTIPAWRIFEKDFPRETLEGSIVFIGTSASGLKDLRATPLNPAAPGVETHAQMAEQILLQNFLMRPDWAEGAELLYLLFLGLVLIFLLPRLGAAWCAILGLGSIATAFYLSWHAFTAWHWLLDPVFPSIVVLAVYMASSLISYLKSEAERRQVRGAFSRYMSPVLVEQLALHPERLKLGGEMKNMTLLFADIRGFTTISEQFDPEGLTHFINQFMTPMTEIILESQGTIDKYMGDCIMAFWNAPLDDPRHSSNACRAALQMQEKLVRLNRDWEAQAAASGEKYLPVRIGIGLNTGQCCVGNMGSEQRFDYSVLGDNVNLASRLEGQSKTYGVDIVIGDKTKEEAEGFAALELDLIRVKGKTLPVRIYALLGDRAFKEKDEFQKLLSLHQKMLSAYRAQEWEKAAELAGECLKSDFNLKPLYKLYTDRIKTCQTNPPGKEWDGVYTATSK